MKLFSYSNTKTEIKPKKVIEVIQSFPNFNEKIKAKREHLLSINELQKKSLLFIRPRHSLNDLIEKDNGNNVLKMFDRTNLQEGSIFHLPSNGVLYSYKPFNFQKRRNMFMESMIQDYSMKNKTDNDFQIPESGHSLMKE